MARKIGMVIRPLSSEEELGALRSVVADLREDGREVLPRMGFEQGDGRRYAREAVDAGVELVIAAGGDGTVNEVVNGLARCERRPPLAVLPMGTANDFAHGLGLPEDLSAAARVAVEGIARRVDLARLNNRFFVNASTGGFGAEATESAPLEAKRMLGAWAYLVTGARQFVDLRPVEGRFETAEGEVFEEEFLLYAVGNGRMTGGGTLLTPRAEPDDGELDLLIVRSLKRMDFLSLLPDLRAGSHLDSPDIVYRQTASVLVTTRDTLSVNADGEPLRGRRFEYRLDAEPLRVMTRSG